MIITIAGPAGSGKGTVSRMLAEKLGYARYSAGDFRRMAAKNRGMTIEEYNILGETDSSTDTEADEYQRKLGLEEDNFIIDGRVGWYFIPHSIKIFLDVDDNIAAARIFNDKSVDRINQTKVHSLIEQKKISMNRNASDRVRYKKIYGMENFADPKHFDLVIDTSHITPEEVVNKIIGFIKHKF